jgi:hypothetical protein
MRRPMATSSLLALLFSLATGVDAQAGFAGTWVTYSFGPSPNFIDLRVDGGGVTGAISRNAEAVAISGGAVSGNTVTFSVVYAAGHRTTTYTGRLDGDVLAFTRSVRVRPGGNAGGTGIFGGGGPMEFVASREATGGLLVPRALFGNWRWDAQRSTLDPPPFGWIAEQRSYYARPDGGFGILGSAVGAEGVAAFFVTHLKADARDYPVYNGSAVGRLLETGAETDVTRSFQAASERTFDLTYKTNGVVTGRSRVTVSPDGLTLTDAGTNVDAQGRTTSTYSMVFTRVVPALPST